MKRILLTIGVLFTSQSFAVSSTTFCSSPTMAHQSGCVSTCSAIATAGSYILGSGNYAYCEGVATKLTEQIYKIELGKLEVGNESRCTIWEGDDMTLEGGGSNKAVLSSKYPISLKSCTVGTTYNAIYFTLARHVKFAGESVFPDGSGKMARTTAAYASKDSSHNDSPVSAWRDSVFADTGKHYTAVDQWDTGNSKKLTIEPSSTDLVNESNITMNWDEVKTSYNWGSDTTTRPDFLCTPGDSSTCTGEIQNDRFVTIMPTEGVEGFPYTMKQGDETLNLEWVKYSSIRGTDQSKGLKFLWTNDGGTLKYAGVGVTYDDSYMAITGAGPAEGL